MEAINFTDILLASIGFLIVYTLNGIKSEIKEVKTSMNHLSENLISIDKRLIVVETKCSVEHGHTKKQPGD